jgi:hypothetical protein
MTTNVHPEYLEAEREYHNAYTDEARLEALEKMMRYMPKHKGAENLRKNLRTRYKKLRQEMKKSKKNSSKKGIKKEDLQAVIVGLTNSGKSSILNAMTNAKPKIASYGFTTSEPEIGTMNYEGCSIQLIDLPPIASENFDRGIVNNADTIVIAVEKVHEVRPIMEILKSNKKAKIIVAFNKIDLYDEDAKRKISETLHSKRYNFALISAITGEGLDELKEKIFKSFDIIRVYTRHPGKKQDNVPVTLPPDSDLRDVAEKILHGYSKKVKHAKIWGPSAKFLGQRVGLKHKLKDKDVIEFYTE